MVEKELDDGAADVPAEDALNVPRVVTWKLDETDREALASVKRRARVTGTADLMRFCVGAADRELARAEGGKAQ